MTPPIWKLNCTDVPNVPELTKQLSQYFVSCLFAPVIIIAIALYHSHVHQQAQLHFRCKGAVGRHCASKAKKKIHTCWDLFMKIE